MINYFKEYIINQTLTQFCIYGLFFWKLVKELLVDFNVKYCEKL